MNAAQRLALAKLAYQRALVEAGRIGGASAWRRLVAARRNLRCAEADAAQKPQLA